jgi:hypothetical protein
MQKVGFSFLFSILSVFSVNATTIYETYTQDWSCFPVPSTCSICQPVCNFFWGGNTLDIAFASFNFPGGGLGGMTETKSQIQQVISFVHGQGGKVKISFGGATAPYFLNNSNSWPNVLLIASNIAVILNDNVTWGFDGADFDIETPNAQAPAGFANSLITLLTTLRQAVGPSKIISLTVPGQGWGTYIETVCRSLANAKVTISGAQVDVVNYFFFMEYDIWVPTGGSYAQQIATDIGIYGPGTAPTNWQVPFNKIMLGLMPGKDDLGRVLALTDVVGNGQANTGLVNFALRNGLYGIGTWDLNIDYAGAGGQGSLAYSKAIVAALAKGQEVGAEGDVDTVDYGTVASPIGKQPYTSNSFQVQSFPPADTHGSPNNGM